ncbi:MAG: MBL fold metallo-hydrolase [Planctomycetota bacterium]|nr:MBL fold metallo-hydrolase [Planctomycetota bacterium]
MAEPLAAKFWGVRGSIPCPGKSTSKYGGNTSCIQVLGGDDVIILDAGTGIRELGMELVKSKKPLRIHILLSHTHWDHIQGFPFFTPIYFPGNEIFVYGPRALEKSLEEALMFQLQYSYFPVRGVELAARVKFTELDEESFKIGDIEFTSRSMNHPIRVLAYKFSRDGRSGIYTGDNEPYYDVLSTKTSRIDTGVHRRAEFIQECNDRVLEFFTDSNLLIADAQYTDEEYATKRGWGNSSVSLVLEVASKANVERLALFHHEPAHVDKEMDQIHKEAVKAAKKLNPKMEVHTAQEGMVLEV